MKVLTSGSYGLAGIVGVLLEVGVLVVEVELLVGVQLETVEGVRWLLSPPAPACCPLLIPSLSLFLPQISTDTKFLKLLLLRSNCNGKSIVHISLKCGHNLKIWVHHTFMIKHIDISVNDKYIFECKTNIYLSVKQIYIWV